MRWSRTCKRHFFSVYQLLFLLQSLARIALAEQPSIQVADALRNWPNWTAKSVLATKNLLMGAGLGNEGCRSTRLIGFFTDDCLLLQWGYR